MQKTLSFRLSVEPMPAPRPRMRVITPRGRKPIATVYSPANYKEWQGEMAAALKALDPKDVPASQLDGPVAVTVWCVPTRPKTTKLIAPKPDVDNYAKGVLDALTKDGRFWNDDTQVTRLSVRKLWSTDAVEPGIYLDITPLDPKEL